MRSSISYDRLDNIHENNIINAELKKELAVHVQTDVSSLNKAVFEERLKKHYLLHDECLILLYLIYV